MIRRVWMVMGWACLMVGVAAAPARAAVWTFGPSLPQARVLVRVTSDPSGDIWTVGGSTFADPPGTGYGPDGAVLVLRAGASSWQQVTTTPQISNEPAIGMINGQLYVAGGRIQTNPRVSNQLWRYDPSTDTWTELAPMPQARAYAAAVVSDGHLFVIGGMTRHGFPRADTYEYLPKTDTWLQLAPLPMQDGYVNGTLGNDGKIYVIGGQNSERAGRLFAYDPSADQWEQLPRVPLRRRRIFAPGVVTTADGRILVIGGYVKYGTTPDLSSRSTEIYSPATGTWKGGPLLNEPRGFMGATRGADGVIYVIGGEVKDVSFDDCCLASVETLTP